MTWNTFHHRGEILRTVIETADARRDGVLPMQVPGVAENFRDELDLLAALWLKWNARLSGNIERALTTEPIDLEDAVASAWRLTSEQLPGVRAILDRYVDAPSDATMATAVARATEKEWLRLAAAAGLANDESPAAARAGRQVEMRARVAAAQEDTQYQSDEQQPAGAELPTESVLDAVTTDVDDEVSPSLVERIRSVLAA